MELAAYAIWGIVFGFVLSAPVGPVNIICLRRALFGRARDGFVIGLGAALGDCFYAGLAAFGLTAIFALIEENSIALRLVGGLIMLVFAIRIWRSHPHIDNEPLTGGTLRGAFGALVLTLANPGIFLGFLGLYSLANIGNIHASEAGFIMTGATLVFGVLLGSATWWVLLVSIARLFKNKIDDKLLSGINHVSAVLIGVFAVVTLASGLISGEIAFI